MSTTRQIAASLALLAGTLIALLLIALAQITPNITWYVASTFIASFVIFFVSIDFAIKRNQQNQRQLLLSALQLDTLTKQSLQDILCKQANKTSVAGKSIDDKTRKLAINSAEVSFFLEKLSNAIELSSENVDRLASAAEQMSISIKVMNDNAAIASQQSSQAMTATSAGSQQLNDNVQVSNQLNSAVINAAEKIKLLSKKATEIQNITNVIDGISRQTNLLYQFH